MVDSESYFFYTKALTYRGRMQLNDKDHYDLFSKPKSTSTTSLGSENSHRYKRYIPEVRDINWLVQYFIFEEKKRRGFTSKYLTKNPYENDFAEYVALCEARDKGLPPSVAHSRLLSELEGFHKKALASLS